MTVTFPSVGLRATPATVASGKLLFVGGVMSLAWIAGITVRARRKLLPRAEATSCVAGALLVLGGFALLIA